MRIEVTAGSLTVVEDVVLIARRGWVGQGAKERCIRIENITGVDFKQATAFSPGHLRIIHPSNETSLMRDYDPDTIMFRIDEQEVILPIRSELMRRVVSPDYIAEPPANSSTGIVAIQLAAATMTVVALVWWAIT